MSTIEIPVWDLWEHKALQCGVPPRLAAMGRKVIAEWYQQGKDDSVLGEESDGEYMIDICLNDPDAAEGRFRESLGLPADA